MAAEDFAIPENASAALGLKINNRIRGAGAEADESIFQWGDGTAVDDGAEILRSYPEATRAFRWVEAPGDDFIFFKIRKARGLNAQACGEVEFGLDHLSFAEIGARVGDEDCRVIRKALAIDDEGLFFQKAFLHHVEREWITLDLIQSERRNGESASAQGGDAVSE